MNKKQREILEKEKIQLAFSLLTRSGTKLICMGIGIFCLFIANFLLGIILIIVAICIPTASTNKRMKEIEFILAGDNTKVDEIKK